MHVIITAVALFSWNMCFALIEKTPMVTHTATTDSPFVNNVSKIIATDNRFTDMNAQTGSLGAYDFTDFYNKSITNRIVLTINPDQLMGVKTPSPVANPVAYTFSVQLSIVIWKYDHLLGSNRMVAQPAILRTLAVNYDPAKRHTQQALLELTGADAGYKIEVTVVNPITFNPVSSNLSYRIHLGTQIEAERYYKYGGTTFHLSPDKTYNATTGLLKVDWGLSSLNNLPEEYELEWIYIDNYLSDNTSITAANLHFNNEYFAKNSTRITTKNTYYQIPVIYPKGFIIYRVRPFWRTSHDGYLALAPGVWSSDDPDYVDDYKDCTDACESEPTEEDKQACRELCGRLANFPSTMYYEVTSGTAHETGMNWQYSLSFAEGAKSVASVNYFDGSYKTRQTVTKPIKEDDIITSRFEQSTTASETIYDYNGRAAVTTLPVPTDNAKINYNRLFSRYSSTIPYSADHFDRDEDAKCNTIALPMHNSNGSARYYSPNHEFPNGAGGIPRPEEKYIPDSKGFPFVQSVFSPDNTGRIIKKSGAGIDHSIGRPEADRHETRYFYGKPFQEELDRWFGSEVGDASFYKKDMVIDPNGQISISYLNPAGKVIATNLAGIRPAQMDSLPTDTATVVVDLLHKSSRTALNELGTENRLELDKSRKMLYRELLVDTKQNYYFGYETRPEKFSIECEGQYVCYDCVLDLTVSLTDECGKEFLAGAGAYGGDSLLVDTTINKHILNAMQSNPAADPSSTCATPIPAYKKNLNTAGDDVSGSGWGTNKGSSLTPVQLEKGNYSLKKILKVNQKALDGYTQKYLEKECLKDLASFKSIEELKISKTGCNITCADCRTELGAFSLYDCDNPEHNPAYPCLTQEEYNVLLAECDEFCDLSMKCKTEFEVMLSDMSPQGQYGEISKAIELVNGTANTDMAGDEVRPYLFALSVFNEGNFLPIKTSYVLNGTRPTWRFPYVPYRNELGTEDFITVYKDQAGNFLPEITNANKAVLNSDGTYRIRPEHLKNVADFINYWKPSWARSLVYYHPEYGYYELCSEQDSSNIFDDKWMSITTFADAIDPVKGFGGTTSSPNFLNTLNMGDPSTSLDPYFRTDNPRYDLNELTHMNSTIAIFANGYSMRDLAFRMAVCPNADLACSSPCNLSTDFSLLTVAERDLFWNNYKSLYASLKQRFVDKKMAKLAIAQKNSYNGCIGEENFNPFKHNFIFTPFTTFSWLPFTSWWTQLFNFQQPCNFARYAYYKGKKARFEEATRTVKMSSYDLNLCYSYSPDEDSVYVVECQDKTQKIVDEAKAITELAVFKQCGQCPLAFDFQQLLNEMLETGLASTSITCSGGNPGYKTLTPRLHTALGATYTGVTWTSGTQQEDEERDSYYLEGSFAVQYSTCNLRLQFPDNTSSTYQFDDILQFYTLKYDPFTSLGTQSNGSFTVIAIVKKPGYNATTGRHLTEEIIMQGSFPCFDLANCDFQPICRPSKLAVDFQSLMNNLLSDKHPLNPDLTLGTSRFYSSATIPIPSEYITESLKNTAAVLSSVHISLAPSSTWSVISHTPESLLISFNNCTIKLIGPSSSLDQIISFSGIMPDPDNQPRGFLITARLSAGGYLQLKGISDCLDIGTCITELPYPYQMGKPEKEDLEYDLNASLVNKLKTGGSPTKEGNVVDQSGFFIGRIEETNNCSARFEMPPVPYPAFSFFDVIAIVDVRPDKERQGPNNFIAYAQLRDGRIVPLRGYTVNCPGNVSACRYFEHVVDGGFEEYDEQDTLIDYLYVTNSCAEPGTVSSIDATAAAACSNIKSISGHTSLTGSSGTNPDEFLFVRTSSTGLSKKKVWTQTFNYLTIGREYTFKMHYMNAGNINCAANDSLADSSSAKIKPDFLWVELDHALNTVPGVILRQELTCDPSTGWMEFTYVWKAEVTTLTINIYNEERDSRNFLAIDDISFGRNCPCVPYQLVSNGDFVYGTSDFATDLTVNNSSMLTYNQYTYTELANTSGPVNYLSGTMKDHTTPGNGKFLLCKVMPNSDWPSTLDPEPVRVWKKTMYVEPGKEYVFNAWYNFDNPSNSYNNTLRITLKVNNQVVQQMLNGTKGLTWQIIEGKWNSGGNTSAVIEVLVENLTNWGAEVYLGFDDIGFTRMCQPQFCHPPQQLPLLEVDSNPCLTQMNKIIDLNARIKYEEYLADVKKKFQDAYIAKCLQSYESFLMKYKDGSNHVTLYYYDQAGNLVRTIPPKGVVPLTGPDLAAVEQDRRNGTHTVFTSHTYATTYRYNSLNQLLAQSVPDNEDLDIWNTEGINTGLSNSFTMNGLSFVSKYGIAAGVDGTFGKMYKTSSSGASWELINPEIKLDNIIDLHVIDASNVIALASNGRFLVSTDGAATWKVKSLGFSNEMVKMHYVTSPSAAIHVYDKAGNKWTSANSGDTWSTASVTTPLPSGKDIRTINFYGSTATTYSGVAILADNSIYFTANGGASWTSASGISLNTTLSHVQKVNNYLTVAAGKNGTLLKSGDAGNTWTQVHTHTGADIKEVYFSSANDGCMLDESGNLYFTEDGGVNWTKTDLVKNKLNNGGPYTDIAFVNKTNGYALNSTGQLLYTNNGGKGWTNRNSGSALTNMTALQVLGPNELFIIGKDCKMRYSLDGGTTMVIVSETNLGWYTMDNVKRLHLSLDLTTGHYKGICNDINNMAYALDVNLLTLTPAVTYTDASATGLSDFTNIKNLHFNSGKQGYALSDCRVFETTDGGQNWVALQTCIGMPALSNALWMEYASSMHKGIVVGETGMIQNTTNYVGSSWTNRTTKVKPLAVRMVKSVSSGQWIAVGDKGTYMTSTDNGDNWYVAANPETSDFADLSVNNLYEVYVAGSGGFIKRTTDGITWNGAYPGVSSSSNIRSVAINFSSTPYFKGSLTTTSGKVYNLEYDGALPEFYKWVPVTALNNTAALPLISFTSNNALWIVAGSRGKIYKTTNLASVSPPTWIAASKFVLPPLNDVKLVDQHTAYAVGENGIVVKTENLQDATSIWELQNTLVTDTLLAVDVIDTVAVAVGRKGRVIATSNGGATWSSFTFGSVILNDVDLHSRDFGVIVGNNNTIYKNTSNVTSGSGSWSSVTPPVGGSTNLNGVSIVNKKYWIVVGDAGKVYQQAESGSWTNPTDFRDANGVAYTVSSINFKDVHFKDYLTGYILGQNGELFKTANKCSTFVKQTSGTTNTLEAISYANNRNIFIGGGSGSNSARRISDEKNLASSLFYYDKLGRLVVSQNSKQRAKSAVPYIYSYTKYDAKGRIIEVGEKTAATSVETTFEGESGRMSDALFNTWLGTGAASTKKEVTRTYYDDDAFVLSTPNPFTQENLRNRVASVTYESVNDSADSTYETGTHYSYDIHGNVKTLVQEFQNLPVAVADHKFKRTDYEYDLISGKVNKVSYQKGEADQFFHLYEYDEENKLTHALTSSNGVLWEQDARYLYYRHGPLARVELGHDKVQGIDYAYTIQGWIKGVNSNTVNAARDIGHDGVMSDANNPNRYFAQDEYGYSLGYFSNDYAAIDAPLAQNHFLASTASSSLASQTKDVYNGNISHMVTGIRRFMQGSAGPQAMIYTYDQLNRIKATNMTNTIDVNNNQWGTGTSTNYNENFSYDANGNILTLQRKNDQGQLMDDLTYKYLTIANGVSKNTNKLGAVSDAVGGGTDDIKSGQVFNTADHRRDNYQYDNIGNLVRDSIEEIDTIQWTVSGKIKSIKRVAGSGKPDLEYIYDASGNRILKIVKPAGSTSDATWKYTLYARDAQGNVLATYELKTEKLVDYAALNNNYSGINSTLISLAGAGGFRGFISSMHNSNTSFINNLQGRVNSDPTLGETILRNDLYPQQVINSYDELYKTIYLSSDIEALSRYYDQYNQTALLRYAYEDTRNITSDRKRSMLGHILMDNYSRKNYLWAGLDYLPPHLSSCAPFSYFSIAANLGFSGSSSDYSGMTNYVESYIGNQVSTDGFNKAYNDIFDTYENFACLGGDYYNQDVVYEAMVNMWNYPTDEPDPSISKVIAGLPQSKMYLQTMTMMQYYNANYGSFIEWLASSNEGLELLIRGYYMYNQSDAETMFNNYFGYVPTNENDAVYSMLLNFTGGVYFPSDMLAALNSNGIYDNSFELLTILQLTYSAFPVFFEDVMVNIPDRTDILNDPSWVSTGANELYNMSMYTLRDYENIHGYRFMADFDALYSSTDLWNKLLSFSTGTYNINWYINYYRYSNQAAFFNSVITNRPAWVADYQQSTNLYGGANSGINNYFTQIRNYFGQAFYEVFEQQYKNSSNKYLETFTLEDWNIYGSSRVGLNRPDKTLYTQNFTGSVVSNKLVKSSPGTPVEAVAYAGTDAIMRGDKRFELSNHLGNVLAVVSDRITPQQGNVFVDISFAGYPNGRLQFNTLAGAYYPLYSFGTTAGQTYKFDIKLNPNTAGMYTVIVKNIANNAVVALQTFSNSYISTDYSLLFKAPGTSCRIELYAANATTWYVNSFKAQNLFVNATPVAALRFEDYISGTGTWAAVPGGVAISNSSGKLWVQSSSPVSENGITSGSITTVPGKHYRIRAYIEPTGTTSNQFIFGHQDAGYSGLNSIVYVNGTGWYEVHFTALTTATRIVARNYQTSAFSYYIDNFSVEEVSADQYRRYADVLQATDYYAFGSPMPGRTYNAATATKPAALNDNFTSTTSGWSAAGATMALDAGRLKCTASSGASRLVSAVPNTVPGRWYAYTLTLDKGTATGVRLYAKQYNSGLLADEIATVTANANGTYTLRFKATTTTTFVYAEVAPYPQVGKIFWIDNVSVTEEGTAAEMADRYGFNGMERDNEIYGDGMAYTTEYRQYDSRLGRWQSIDPEFKKLPDQSPYANNNNNPVSYTDPKGDFGFVGALIGAAAGAVSEITSQVVTHAIKGEPLFKKIDWADVAISAGEGALVGTTAGASLLITRGVAATAKAAVDVTSDGVSTVGGIGGTKSKSIQAATTDLVSSLAGNTLSGIGDGASKLVIRGLSKGSPGVGNVFTKLAVGETLGGIVNGGVSGTVNAPLQSLREWAFPDKPDNQPVQKGIWFKEKDHSAVEPLPEITITPKKE